MRYKDEELSRILTAHANGLLYIGGRYWDGYNPLGVGCVNQFAYNEGHIWVAVRHNPAGVRWFDSEYSSHLTDEDLLALLEEVT